jgi:hypothetical protein
MPPSEETELLRQITDREASDRDRAAALLHGRDLSPKATQALVWQLRHRDPAYRKAAMDALWDSTISDAVAALVLAGQLEHRKPELRAVARQVLQNATSTSDPSIELRNTSSQLGEGALTILRTTNWPSPEPSGAQGLLYRSPEPAPASCAGAGFNTAATLMLGWMGRPDVPYADRLTGTDIAAGGRPGRRSTKLMIWRRARFTVCGRSR